MTVSTTNSTSSLPSSNETCPAKHLTQQQRQSLAEKALSGITPVSHLAEEAKTSRKFIYSQKKKAQKGIDQAFAESKADDVLFTIPVTKAWIAQVVIALVMICHAPFRGVLVFLRDVLDYKIGLGTIHNIVRDNIKTAQNYQQAEDLSPIKAASHDEIFQGGKPVLAGVDLDSTYCYLLEKEPHRDATTWGVHFLDCEAKGFHPDYTIADGGTGLRAGQREALPDIPCHGDVFHILMEMGKINRKLENKAYRAIKAFEKLQKKAVSKESLFYAAIKEQKCVENATHFDLLLRWMQDDILGLNGLDQATRHELYDFVVHEVELIEANQGTACRAIRISLQRQKEQLLGFATRLDNDMEKISLQHKQPIEFVQRASTLQGKSTLSSCYWQEYASLQSCLGEAFRAVMEDVAYWREHFHRASSLVENLNSRLRQYFFLRRQIGHGYLDLLRFYFNHRIYERSQRPERTGHSPAELMTGEKHPHWLEILGFERFKKQTIH
jgi:hypothetical protein